MHAVTVIFLVVIAMYFPSETTAEFGEVFIDTEHAGSSYNQNSEVRDLSKNKFCQDIKVERVEINDGHVDNNQFEIKRVVNN